MKPETQFSCYILFSEALNKFYVGYTSAGVNNRLEKHNSSLYGSHFTSQVNDWKVMLEIKTSNASVARNMELYIKKMKSRKFILKLINDKEELKTFIQKFESIGGPRWAHKSSVSNRNGV